MSAPGGEAVVSQTTAEVRVWAILLKKSVDVATPHSRAGLPRCHPIASRPPAPFVRSCRRFSNIANVFSNRRRARSASSILRPAAASLCKRNLWRSTIARLSVTWCFARATISSFMMSRVIGLRPGMRPDRLAPGVRDPHRHHLDPRSAELLDRHGHAPVLDQLDHHLDWDAVPMDQQAFAQAVGPRGSEELKGATLLLTTSLPVLGPY